MAKVELDIACNTLYAWLPALSLENTTSAKNPA